MIHSSSLFESAVLCFNYRHYNLSNSKSVISIRLPSFRINCHCCGRKLKNHNWSPNLFQWEKTNESSVQNIVTMHSILGPNANLWAD